MVLGNERLFLRDLRPALSGLTGWLLSDAVLRSSSARAGAGVVNYVGPDGQWDALYPEICGYYLQFLAQAASLPGSEDARLRLAAVRVGSWLNLAGGLSAEPLTLYHRNEADSDWRNSCLFTFDLAIILRGIAAAEAQWPGSMPDGLEQRYAVSLARININGRLNSHLVRHHLPLIDIPEKWSTTLDVHHVKAAAALVGLQRSDLDALARTTLQDEAKLFNKEKAGRMRELHPFLYSIEGWLTIWGQTQAPEALQLAANAFEMILSQVDPVSGEMPPTANAFGAVVRSDVLAQTLRSGLVLEAAGQLKGTYAHLWGHTRLALADAILARQSPEGGMLFDQVGYHRNSWASMFSWQALHFLELTQNGKLDAVAAATSLI